MNTNPALEHQISQSAQNNDVQDTTDDLYDCEGEEWRASLSWTRCWRRFFCVFQEKFISSLVLERCSTMSETRLQIHNKPAPSSHLLIYLLISWINAEICVNSAVLKHLDWWFTVIHSEYKSMHWTGDTFNAPMWSKPSFLDFMSRIQWNTV